MAIGLAVANALVSATKKALKDSTTKEKSTSVGVAAKAPTTNTETKGVTPAGTNLVTKSVDTEKISGNKGTSTNYGTYQNDLDRLTKAQRQAQVDELKAARTQALANLDAQEQNIRPTYQNARNLTSANSQQGARSFAEYLANRGLTNSGAAAQGEINRLSALNNNLGNINQAEANAYRDIANQRTAVENNYISGLANANNALTTNYYNNLLNYNEQQRQYLQQLQQQANYQYYDDIQARINELLTQGYSPYSTEILQLQALRGQKQYNNYNNAINNALTNVQSGNINYNNAAALGMTVPQAYAYSNTYNTNLANQAQLEAEERAAKAEQQQWENNLAYDKYLLDKAQTEYNTNKPYNTTVYHVSSGGGDKSNGNNYLTYTDVANIVDGLTLEDARKKIDSLYNSGKIEDWVFDLYQ